jgi:hypothetical protein
MIFEVQLFWLTVLYPVAIVIQSLYAHRIYLISKKRWLTAMIVCVSHPSVFFIELEIYDILPDVVGSIC